MLKYIKGINTDKVILFLIVATVISGSWLYMDYTAPKDIYHQYNGIKYQNGNPSAVEPIHIEIEGKYKRTMLGDSDEFIGKIKIQNEAFDFSKYHLKFNRYKMAFLDSGPFFSYGMIYIDNRFEKIAIDIFEYKGNDTHGPSGWKISAPCSNRNEAVEITNEMVRKLSKALMVQ